MSADAVLVASKLLGRQRPACQHACVVWRQKRKHLGPFCILGSSQRWRQLRCRSRMCPLHTDRGTGLSSTMRALSPRNNMPVYVRGHARTHARTHALLEGRSCVLMSQPQARQARGARTQHSVVDRSRRKVASSTDLAAFPAVAAAIGAAFRRWRCYVPRSGVVARGEGFACVLQQLAGPPVPHGAACGGRRA